MTITHLTDHSLRGMLKLEEAATCLLDYRPPGSTIGPRERSLLAAKIAAGYSPSDAAEAVQAETWVAP